ncbi:MAG: AAA family ATPase [Candidatus Aenigmarchaeota archaeon]|nr:AAA family ATPase [Candidatus Aenigmarchaeota archaeon]
MLLQKYEPRSLQEFVGNRQQTAEILQWIKGWKKGALMIHGPPGVGKSLAVKLAAKELGLELLQRHANDQADVLKESVLKAAQQKSLFSKGKILLIDDLEQLDSSKHVVELIKSSRFPVVLVASNPYDMKLAALRNYCKMVKFQKLRADEIARFLKLICETEGIKYEEAALKQLCRTSNGDIRAALMDLETLKPEVTLRNAGELGDRGKEDNIFETVRLVLKATSIQSAALAVQNSERPEIVLAWLEENILNEYTGIEEIAEAYDWLSKADIFYSRIIRRQSWSLQKYANALGFYGVALSKRKARNSFVQYSVPKRRFKAGSTEEDLASLLHVSRRRIGLYRPLIKSLEEKIKR